MSSAHCALSGMPRSYDSRPRCSPVLPGRLENLSSPHACSRRKSAVRRTNKEPGSEEYDVVLAVSFTFVRDGAVVDEAERGPGRTSEWEGSRPANPPGVAAGLGFRSREISRTRTTATRHHQAGRPGICDSYSVSDVQDLAQTAFRRRVLHEDVLAVQSTCRWEQPPNLAAGAGDNRTTAWAVTRSG